MATAKATTKAKATKSKEAPVVKSLEDLKKDLLVKQTDMIEAKRGHRAGELVNPRVLTHTRKDIARLKTAIRAEELKETK